MPAFGDEVPRGARSQLGPYVFKRMLSNQIGRCDLALFCRSASIYVPVRSQRASWQMLIGLCREACYPIVSFYMFEKVTESCGATASRPRGWMVYNTTPP